MYIGLKGVKVSKKECRIMRTFFYKGRKFEIGVKFPDENNVEAWEKGRVVVVVFVDGVWLVAREMDVGWREDEDVSDELVEQFDDVLKTALDIIDGKFKKIK